MWKKNKYFIIIALFVVVIWVVEYNKPRQINWYESYSKYDKIPYGNKILFKELPSIFSQGIFTANKNIQETLEEENLADNYLFINNTFLPTEGDLNGLLNFVGEGNNAFVISDRFETKLLDTLALEIEQSIIKVKNDTLHFSINENQQNYKFVFKHNYFVSYFSADSNKNCIGLGFVSDSLINFLKVPFGQGYFYLHCNPLVFTNYHMQKNDNYKYVSAVLSHLADTPIYWDEYYKNSKNAVPKSHLSVVLGIPGLRQAIYLVVISLFVYMLFALKRRQRIIPVVPPKANDTLNFVRTIGQLYYNENNNKDIGLKRMDYFLAHVRKQYHINSKNLDEDFCLKLHKMSGVDIDEVKKLVANFNVIKGVQEISDERIFEQDKLIESFYKKTRYNG